MHGSCPTSTFIYSLSCCRFLSSAAATYVQRVNYVPDTHRRIECLLKSFKILKRMNPAVADVVRFFMLQATSLSHELQEVFADQVSDVEFSGNAVMTAEEITSLIHKAELRTLATVSAELKHIATLAGSLASQLIDQAGAHGVVIEPKVTELEEETRMQLVSQLHNQDTGIKPVQGKLELKQIQDPQTVKQMEDLQARVSALEKELADKVQNTSQYKTLQKMLQTKTTEIEELELRVKELTRAKS